ncbi:hypothetical protein [Sulfurihydrogenibium sp.]|uniref:hypothetical protein n=1 Tax=Sulfurihydrogenibium sp. TaxID=2053621 RepID=UPI00262F2D31|nr:hypothetical protein [Sulfurihydrogenibium sp.]
MEKADPNDIKLTEFVRSFSEPPELLKEIKEPPEKELTDFSSIRSIIIPTQVRELLKKLEFLAMIEVGKKPCMNDLVFVDKESWMGAFYRNRSGESRKGNMMQIEQIIDQTITAINDLQKVGQYTIEERNNLIMIILRTLRKAKVGILKLTETYHDSPITIAHINVIISNIDLQLIKFGC